MKIIKCLVIAFCLQQPVFAQSPEEIKQLFSEAEIVYQNYEEELSLFLQNDIPVGEQKNNVNMFILSEKNGPIYSRHEIYQSGFDSLIQLNAYTKTPAGSKINVKSADIKTSGSRSGSTFYDDLKETIFDFPSLSKNAIAHVDYTLFLKDAHLLSSFDLPVHIPIVNASYSVRVPNGIKIKYLVKNDPKQLFHFTEEKKKKETIYTWTINNVKAQDYFPDAPNGRYFQPHIIVYVTSYESKNGPKPYLGSLQDLYNWEYSFLKDLNTTEDPSLKKIVDSLVKGETSERNKVRKIYQWVQNHIRYVAFENGLEGFRPRQAADICAKRYGDCKDMSSIITQMLHLAGIKSYFTWIGTRSIPYNYSEIPLPKVANHMITTAKIDGEWLFLDGTDPNAKFDMPPEAIQGKEAMLSINEKEYKLLVVPVTHPEKSSIVDSTFISVDDTGLKGYESVNYNGYFGKEVYNSLLYRNEKETKEYVNKRMSKGSNKFILGTYTISKTSPEDNLANIRASFELPGYSKKIGKEYYINLNLEKLLDNRVIDTMKRNVPIENDYNYNIKQYHILEIPEGYGVSYLPKNYSFENDLIKVEIYYKVENKKVIAAQEIQTKRLMIHPADFKEWNKPMTAIQPYYKESVVLEKK